MLYQITQYAICIPLTNKQWNRLIKLESDHYHKGKEDLVTKALKPFDVDEIDYNGHFGRNFFFKVESLDKMDEILVTLENLLGKN